MAEKLPTAKDIIDEESKKLNISPTLQELGRLDFRIITLLEEKQLRSKDKQQENPVKLLNIPLPPEMQSTVREKVIYFLEHGVPREEATEDQPAA